MKDDWSIPYIPMDAVSREEERRRQIAQTEFIASLARTTWQWTLAHNLAIAGALCRANDIAYRQGEYDANPRGGEVLSKHSWSPGCGRSAP